MSNHEFVGQNKEMITEPDVRIRNVATAPTTTVVDPLYLEDESSSRTQGGSIGSCSSSEDLQQIPPNDASHAHTHLPQHFSSSEKLGVIPLAVIVFYSVSGGPLGIEPAVRSAGNFYSLLGFLLLPFIWSLQEALMTAELGAAFPEAAGGVAWVEFAFGKQLGFLAGYLGWIGGATDNAIYPVLFLDYVIEAFSLEETIGPWTRWLWLAVCSSVLAYINWLGLPTVGKMSIVICILAMSPFVVLCIIGVFSINPQRWFELPVDPGKDEDQPDASGGTFFSSFGNVMWRPFLNNLFWNGNSFDACASFAAEVDNPGQTFPKALYLSVFMVGSCYFLPLLVTLGASEYTQAEWVDGHLAKAAADIVGDWLGDWTVFAAGISNIAMFQAELSADAFQLMGMADRGYLPSIFSVRSSHGTPTYGILLGTVVIILMTLSNLDELIEMLNFQYSIALLLEYAAFLRLRFAHDDLARPYRIPFGTTGCVLFFAPAIFMTLLVMALASRRTFIFSIFFNVFGIIIYHLMKTRIKTYEDVAVEDHVT